MILNLETTSTTCSVSLSKEGEHLALKELTSDSYTHSENLSQFIEDILKENTVTYKDLKAIAISSGPGSYTGLRIGTATAKGLCYALDIPLVAIDTLKIMADHMMKKDTSKDLYCPMVDARRMEVFTGLFDKGLNEKMDSAPLILDEESFKVQLKDRSILFFGNGAQKFSEIMKDPNASFYFDYLNSAEQMCSLSNKKYVEKDFEDLAYFEPNYLKNFQATVPKQKLKA